MAIIYFYIKVESWGYILLLYSTASETSKNIFTHFLEATARYLKGFFKVLFQFQVLRTLKKTNYRLQRTLHRVSLKCFRLWVLVKINIKVCFRFFHLYFGTHQGFLKKKKHAWEKEHISLCTFKKRNIFLLDNSTIQFALNSLKEFSFLSSYLGYWNVHLEEGKKIEKKLSCSLFSAIHTQKINL